MVICYYESIEKNVEGPLAAFLMVMDFVDPIFLYFFKKFDPYLYPTSNDSNCTFGHQLLALNQ